MSSKELTYEQQEMVSWLNSLCPWAIFFTGTTEWKSTAACLQKCYESFMKKYYPQVSYAYCLEPFSSHGWWANGKFTPAFHMHAMFDAGHDIRWAKFWNRWKDKYGRNRAEPITHKADVNAYVTKYIMKGHDDKTNNSREEVWWNVKLSAYRKHMRKQRQEACLMA